MQRSLTIINPHGLEFAIDAWLHEKQGLSHSEGTERLYRQLLGNFRTGLLTVGLDLNSDTSAVATVLQVWANGTNYSASTTNNRLAVVGSFYEYCIRRELCGITKNPVLLCKRRKVQPYGDARAIPTVDVVSGLQGIDRSTLQGKRDFALLCVALVTGRRLTELRNLKMSDMTLNLNGTITLEWTRTKGGKKMRDTLPRPVSDALRVYLEAIPAPCEYVFVGVATRNGRNYDRLSHVSIEAICNKHMGTTKFHSLRHSFAHAMEEAGAKVSDIQLRLGHTNIGTTGRYLQSLRADENSHADEVARLFGL